eukprot:Blabericola_migrator_1__2107@NODE_1580_length_4237_cov_221_241487_g1032_i0_p5_GENE_NODE_1580_length_4237_cov_221_241487_g1032_i0NODE_1580_length_4237_cov_221_241487_g1032_i0_p5_ORF_typecomplete_len136_score8_17FtsX/PF02687_21/2_4e02_NODE_1580_length_4237_cov_221_241487_g1032_i026223029
MAPLWDLSAGLSGVFLIAPFFATSHLALTFVTFLVGLFSTSLLVTLFRFFFAASLPRVFGTSTASIRFVSASTFAVTALSAPITHSLSLTASWCFKSLLTATFREVELPFVTSCSSLFAASLMAFCNCFSSICFC